MQVQTTTSCGQNSFSSVDMHMKLTVHIHYSIVFLSDRRAKNCLKASQKLENQNASYQHVLCQFHLQHVTLGQWTHFSREMNGVSNITF